MGKNKSQKKSTALNRAVETSLFVLIVLLATYLIFNFVTQRTRVSGTSMETTLYDGDNIMLDKLSYHFGEVKRGDVVCFKNRGETLIKRVIGLPGETVRISSGSIFINGEELRDNIGGISYSGRASGDIVLGKKEYFVLGDNRKDSIDSRYEEIGNIQREDILGKAFLLFYPLNRIRIVK